MNPNDPILEFADVTVAATLMGPSGLSHASARFMPGTLALIHVEPGHEQTPLADLAEGLLVPEEGRAAFQGEAWTAMPPERVLQQRARIGRVFEGHGWISNLNVNENVTLAQRHHTRRPAAEILDEAVALARAFGLAELPKVRPALLSRRDLRRAEWIRAFLGRPLLILLERPMEGVPLEHEPRLLGAVREACARGAAVVWLTSQDRIASAPDLPPVTRYAMQGMNCVKMEKE